MMTHPYAVDIKRYNGDIMLQAALLWRYRAEGIMDNVDDEYAPSKAVIFRCSGR